MRTTMPARNHTRLLSASGKLPTSRAFLQVELTIRRDPTKIIRWVPWTVNKCSTSSSYDYKKNTTWKMHSKSVPEMLYQTFLRLLQPLSQGSGPILVLQARGLRLGLRIKRIRLIITFMIHKILRLIMEERVFLLQMLNKMIHKITKDPELVRATSVQTCWRTSWIREILPIPMKLPGKRPSSGSSRVQAARWLMIRRSDRAARRTSTLSDTGALNIINL